MFTGEKLTKLFMVNKKNRTAVNELAVAFFLYTSNKILPTQNVNYWKMLLQKKPQLIENLSKHKY